MTPLPQLIHYMHLYYFPRGSQHHVFAVLLDLQGPEVLHTLQKGLRA